jgi:hypothetical protein
MASGEVIRLRVLVLKENRTWVAQCIDYDIAAQGTSIPDALKCFEQTVLAQISINIEDGKAPFEGIGPAPEWYAQQYERGEQLVRHPHVSIPKELLEHAPAAWMCDRLSGEIRVGS